MRAGGGVLRGSHVLIILLLSFGVVFAVNIAFAVFAVKTFPGEETPQPYTQGVEYNAALRDLRAQAALGWRAGAAITGDSARTAAVVVSLNDAAGAPIGGAVLVGDLERPTDGGLDRTLRFAPLGGGRYAAPVAGLLEGQWQISVRAAHAGAHFDISKRVTWRPGS